MAVRLGGLPGTLWWRVQSRSGGMLVEQHTHGVDLMRYLAGEVVSASAYASTALLTDVPNLDIADVSTASVRFASGAVGSIVNSCALQPGQGSPPNLAGPVHVIARDMTVMVSAASLLVMRPGQEREETVAEGDPNLKMNRVFVDAVRGGDTSAILSDYEDGLRTFELTYACQLSADEGREVRLASSKLWQPSPAASRQERGAVGGRAPGERVDGPPRNARARHGGAARSWRRSS